jgi:hypothetical protein
MLSYSNLLMMFPKQLQTNHILVLCDNPNQPIHIFGMVSNQFGQLLDLLLELFQAPGHVACWI